MKKLFKLLIASVFASSFCVGTAFALPALQLGNGSGDWVYDTTTSTWVTTSDSFTLNAYANATLDDGGNGDYAWDSAANVMTAYLVASAIPGTTTDPAFGISLTGGPSVSLVGSGYGTPPVEDLNSLSPHGVYPTYFEIYEFVFDPTTKGLIVDQQPGETGSGQGYTHTFDIDVLSLAAGVEGVHFDLFTVFGDGIYDVGSTAIDKNLVYAFAPFSHDAEYQNCTDCTPPPCEPTNPSCEPPTKVSAPATLGLMGLGLLGLAGLRRRK